MKGADLALSPLPLGGLFAIALYCPVAWLVYRRLFPQLAPIAKALAALMLISQAITLAICLGIQPRSEVEAWLWDLNGEWNVPTTLAAIQLALISAVALAAACISRQQKIWHRLYLFGLGGLHLVFAYDEYSRIHESIVHWELIYGAVGAVVVALTLAVAHGSPKRNRRWHFCLLAGLAMSAAGGMLVEQFQYDSVCGLAGGLSQETCPWRHEVEESLELLGFWLVLVAVLGHFSDSLPKRRRLASIGLAAFMALWGLYLAAASPLGLVVIPDWARRAAIEFEPGWHVYGYKLEDDGLPSAVIMQLPGGLDAATLGFSIHLVDQVSGASVASADRYVNRHAKVSRPKYGFRPLYKQNVDLDVPPGAPVNRALWAVLTLWRVQAGDYIRQRIVSSDHPLLDDTQVALGELALPEPSPVIETAPIARFEAGFSLYAASLPESAQAGQTLPITFTWRSAADAPTDLAQFLHFLHEPSGAQWGYDQAPLGPRLPTRLWYNGLADSETWQAPLPSDLAAGSYAVYTGLYRLSDMERLAAFDAAGRPFADARVFLGRMRIDA